MAERSQIVEATERKMKRKCQACKGAGRIKSSYQPARRHATRMSTCGFCMGSGLHEDVQKRTADAAPPLRLTLEDKYRGF